MPERNNEEEVVINYDENGNEEGIEIYRCRYCHRTFASSQALGGHQNSHKHERIIDKLALQGYRNWARLFPNLQPPPRLLPVMHQGNNYLAPAPGNNNNSNDNNYGNNLCNRSLANEYSAAVAAASNRYQRRFQPYYIAAIRRLYNAAIDAARQEQQQMQSRQLELQQQQQGFVLAPVPQLCQNMLVHSANNNAIALAAAAAGDQGHVEGLPRATPTSVFIDLNSDDIDNGDEQENEELDLELHL